MPATRTERTTARTTTATAADDGLAGAFRALADPSRRLLLDRLNERNGQSLCELCRALAMTRQSVSKHLAVLESAGLVSTRRRGREKLHFLDAAPINAIADRWIHRYDRRRAAALADLTHALEHSMHPTHTSTEFVYTTYIRTTAEALWTALTDPAFTRRYWGVALISDWQAGSTITWEFAGITMAGDEQVVLVADRPRRLSYTWHTISPEFGEAVGADPGELAAMAAEPRSHVTFELEPVGEVVELTVHHAGFEPGSAILDGISGGWPSIIASLKSLLETGEPLPAG